DRAPDAEQMQDVEMLLGLRHHAVVGGDGEEDEIHAVRAREHVADEALVAGHVDDAGALAVGVEPGEAEVDRDAARLLLLEAHGVLAGERADERRLPVVDVTGRADDQRHHAARASPKISMPMPSRSTRTFSARNGAGYAEAGPRWKSIQRGV